MSAKKWLIVYSLLWLGIGLMSAYDTFWLVKNREVISLTEKNPLGTWLIELDQGDISIFVATKFAGTIIAMGVLSLLYRCKRRWAWACIIPVFIIQVFVIYYVVYGGSGEAVVP
jgi:hypothetical protein